jgi:hypothetical protein
MLSVTSATRVLVATTPVDLRGSFNRLHSLVVEQLKGDPLSGHFHEKAVKVKFWFTCDYEFERDALARQERIALPSELARESGSRFDPMSLEREECDHLVNGLASRRRCRRTVITPRLASIQMLLLKVFLLWFRPGSAPAWGW